MKSWIHILWKPTNAIMPTKCNKVKNPCKICLESVSNKNGLQCQGACKKWVHFACLNYTPGKIKDIKQGIIKVTCPCPDCKTTVPKEFRTDEPYSCTNMQCPSNMPRSCTSVGCPSNQKMNQTSNSRSPSPLMYCEKGACKDSAGNQPTESFQGPCPITNPVCPPPSCAGTSMDYVGGDMGTFSSGPSINVVEQICNTVGQLTNQINRLMNEMKNVVNVKSVKRTCDQPGPKSRCPKPCYCPNNPHNWWWHKHINYSKLLKHNPDRYSVNKTWKFIWLFFFWAKLFYLPRHTF